MLHTVPKNNTQSILEGLLKSLSDLILRRIKAHFSGHDFDWEKWLSTNEIFGKNGAPEDLPEAKTNSERLIILIALAPHISPGFFENIIHEALPSGGDFPEFGGVKGPNHRSMLPTGETVQFILAGTDIEQRLAIHQYFSEEHFFYRKGILWLDPVKEGEPKMSGAIVLDSEWLEKFLFGKESAPRFGLDFPAHKIATAMNWEDAVLHPQTEHQVKEISIWLNNAARLMLDDNLKRKIRPGYRVLFYGPSGTGKTMTASLLGKSVAMDVYRIDLSQIVSKYIGETERNLETVFKKAESKNWILFFDEADALFGKRTQVQSSHDRYANQEVSYLLQRIEDYPGLLILASNFKNNMDDAFLRRFHSIIHFPIPQSAERLQIWKKTMPSSLKMAEDIDLNLLAAKYELTGAAILNIVQYAALNCFARESSTINQADLIDGIRREFIKEEKFI